MHSMLRQNQVRLQDVKPYIRSFSRTNPVDLADWAKDEGALFEPGTVIFLLEPAKRPPGMSSFARGQQPGGAPDLTQDGFRVKDMCVVVDKVEGKCWVLAISPSAFELRFLDTLFREKSQKSMLEGLDFNYLAAQPRPPLNNDKLKELRQVSTLYSKSGSRRTVAQDGTGPDEPAKAMLAFLGADLGSSIGKQVIELGSICNMIFAPEGIQENKLQSMVKGCFTPILANDRLKDGVAQVSSTPVTAPDSQAANDEVSLLTQAYLESEAREAEEHLSSQTGTNWSSLPKGAAKPADEFNPLEAAPPFNLGMPGAGLGQPSMQLSPEIPAILTGDHPVIALDQKLNTEEPTNGGQKLPSLPAWYLTTHDVFEMNQVALKRAQENPVMPEGLDRLDSELPYAALPETDARFKDSSAAPVTTPLEPAPVAPLGKAAEAAEPAAQQDIPPAQEAPPVALESSNKEFISSVFEGVGARSSLESNPDAINMGKPQARPSGEWQTLSTPDSESFGVAPGTTSDTTSGASADAPTSDWSSPNFVPPARAGLMPPKTTSESTESPAEPTIFEKLSGGPVEPEQPSAHSWASGQGRPTNLKDMLTADSAVFSTSDRGKMETPPPANPEFAEPAPPDGTAKSENEPADASTAAPSEPVPPWTESSTQPAALPDGRPAIPAVEPSMDWSSPSSIEPPSSPQDLEVANESVPAPTLEASPQNDLNGAQTTKTLDEAGLEEASSSAEPEQETEENYRELKIALDGLMESPDSIEAAPAASQRPDMEEVPGDFESTLPPPTATLELEIPHSLSRTPRERQDIAPELPADLFEEVMDKVIDAAEAFAPSEPPLDTIPEPIHLDSFVDGRDLTQDLDTALLKRELHLRLTTSTAAEEEDYIEEVAETDLDRSPSPEPQAIPDTESPTAQVTEIPAAAVTETPAAQVMETPQSTDRFAPPPGPPVGLVSPAMAAHFESMSEQSTETVPSTAEPAWQASSPSIQPTPAIGADPVSPPSATPDVTAPFGQSRDAGSAQPMDTPFTTVAPESVTSSPEPASPGAVHPEPRAVIIPPPPPRVDSVPALPPAAQAQEYAFTDPATGAPETIPAGWQADKQLQTPPAAASDTLPTNFPESMDESGVFLTDREVVGAENEAKLTASGMHRIVQPAVEPKLVISESTRFMARLNQRLSEADKKLSSRCDQSRDRLIRELEALVDEAHRVERQNEISTGSVTEQLMNRLVSVSEDVKSSIRKTATVSSSELKDLIEKAESDIRQLHRELLKEAETIESSFEADAEGLTTTTRERLNEHAQERITRYNEKLEEIALALESVYKHHINVLVTRFKKFETRLNEEVEAIISALDRNVGSMTVEIDGSWERASEKLTSSQTEFANSVSYLVHSCRADIKQVHLDAYASKVLPRLLENKDIFRSMLVDMKRNFEEQSDKNMKKQVAALASTVSNAKDELNTLMKECLSTIESVGKGQQFGLEELFDSTGAKLEKTIATVEDKLKTAKRAIIDNDEAALKTSEASRVEDEPAFSKEKQQAIAALNESRTKADNVLETNISSSCLNLEHLSEQLQEDLARQRADWTQQVRLSADESVMSIKQAIQDAFQAIETAKEKFME